MYYFFLFCMTLFLHFKEILLYLKIILTVEILVFQILYIKIYNYGHKYVDIVENRVIKLTEPPLIEVR